MVHIVPIGCVSGDDGAPVRALQLVAAAALGTAADSAATTTKATTTAAAAAAAAIVPPARQRRHRRKRGQHDRDHCGQRCTSLSCCDLCLKKGWMQLLLQFERNTFVFRQGMRAVLQELARQFAVVVLVQVISDAQEQQIMELLKGIGGLNPDVTKIYKEKLSSPSHTRPAEGVVPRDRGGQDTHGPPDRSARSH